MLLTSGYKQKHKTKESVNDLCSLAETGGKATGWAGVKHALPYPNSKLAVHMPPSTSLEYEAKLSTHNTTLEESKWAAVRSHVLNRGIARATVAAAKAAKVAVTAAVAAKTAAKSAAKAPNLANRISKRKLLRNRDGRSAFLRVSAQMRNAVSLMIANHSRTMPVPTVRQTWPSASHSKMLKQKFALDLFKGFDQVEQGSIDKRHFQNGLLKLSPPIKLSNAELELVFPIFDSNGDGCISFQEFREIIFGCDFDHETNLTASTIQQRKERIKAKTHGLIILHAQNQRHAFNKDEKRLTSSTIRQRRKRIKAKAEKLMDTQKQRQAFPQISPSNKQKKYYGTPLALYKKVKPPQLRSPIHRQKIFCEPDLTESQAANQLGAGRDIAPPLLRCSAAASGRSADFL
jgi:hypothetical protein